MKKKFIIIGTMLLLLFGFSGQSMARIHVGVNVPLPPVFVFSAPPELVVIPGTYVYYCPDVDVDVFFYAGYWYRHYEGYWYRCARYDGPWVYIANPPSVLVSLPHNYRVITRGYRHIPYAELHRNWRAWQRDRYWEHHNWGRTGAWQRDRYSEHHNWGRTERGGIERQTRHGLAPSFRGRERGGSAGAVEGRTQHQTQHGLAPSFRGGERSGSVGGVQHGNPGANAGRGVHGGTGSHGGGGHERR